MRAVAYLNLLNLVAGVRDAYKALDPPDQSQHLSKEPANATVACFLSHVFLMTEIARNFSDDRIALIMEDDVVLPRDLLARLDHLLGCAPDGWTLLKGSSWEAPPLPRSLIQSYPDYYYAGTGAYLIKVSSIPQVLRHLRSRRIKDIDQMMLSFRGGRPCTAGEYCPYQVWPYVVALSWRHWISSLLPADQEPWLLEKLMNSRSNYSDTRKDNMLAHWSAISSIRKPIVAAVGGFALGGGCELAMSCDIIIASEAAKFGQPEIKLGTIPGVGGTQRLIRAVGKSKAMELILTGDMLSAEEAEKAGLVARVVPAGTEVEEAVKTAEKIASFSAPAVQLAKEMGKNFTRLGADVQWWRLASTAVCLGRSSPVGIAAVLGTQRSVGTGPSVVATVRWEAFFCAPASEPAQSLLLHAMAAKLCSKNAIRVYPNVGAAQGEIDLEVARRSTDAEIREALARVVFRDARAVKIFSSQGHEVCSPEQFWAEAPSGLVVSAGGPFRRRGQKEIQAGHSTSPRYDPSLVGSRAIRIDAEDPEESYPIVESLLRAPVPLVITGSKVAGEALGRWNFEYLEKCLSDVDNFFVLCSPEKSKGRFSYYDFSEGKNPCGYKIVPNNHRVEMRFPEFRQKVQSAQGKGDLYYLQNTLLHREESTRSITGVQWLEDEDHEEQALSTIEKAWSLLKASWRSKRRDSMKRTALHWAAVGDAMEAETRCVGCCERWFMEALLDAGAEVDALDLDERTPLHLAAANGQQEAISLLMDASCRIDPLDRHGRSPLYYAAIAHHRDAVALLVDRGHADQSILFHALKEKFGTHNFMLHNWPEYNGRWMSLLAFGKGVSMDIDAFRWDWLKRVMGHREPQMCQLFCGTEGFSPCHYDPQDNMFLQDLQSFPRFQELKGQGIEAILEPGDLLHIPPGWWHHVEMMPSPKGEVVSFNFWYPPPTWFHGDLAKGQITWDRPLFGVRRNPRQELVAHAVGPSKVSAVLKLALEKSPRVPDELVQGLEQLDTFLGPVMEGPERQQLLLDILEAGEGEADVGL
eukprot:g32750.t1